MLAMDVNDNAPCLDARVARTFFASRLPLLYSFKAPDFRGFQAIYRFFALK